MYYWTVEESFNRFLYFANAKTLHAIKNKMLHLWFYVNFANKQCVSNCTPQLHIVWGVSCITWYDTFNTSTVSSAYQHSPIKVHSFSAIQYTPNLSGFESIGKIQFSLQMSTVSNFSWIYQIHLVCYCYWSAHRKSWPKWSFI